VRVEPAPRNTEPIPHWPGEFVSLGDYQVFVRRIPAEANITSSDNPGDDQPGGGEQEARPEPGLCVHGLAGSSRNWTDLMDELRPRLDCEALDLPGFGESPPRPDGRYSIEALADTVTTLIERRGRGAVHLIGNSLGGAVSLKVAASRPELVRSLTLISPALPDPRPRLDVLRFPLACAPGLGNWLLGKFSTLPAERRVANTIAACYCDPASIAPERFAAEVADLGRRDTLSYANTALIGCIRTLVAESLRGGPLSSWRDAARVTVPTLVIYGRNDRLVSARMAGRAARLFSDSRVVVLPRTGHVAMMEHPATVAIEIGMLLDGMTARRSQHEREFPLMSTG
jgi:pimeloyl-ACP methyl ester carboxylesterase